MKNVFFVTFVKFWWFSKILGYSVYLECLIFVKNVSWVLSRRLCDQRENIFWVDYNDSREKHAQSCLKVKKNTENHETALNIFWSEAALLGANN